MSPKTEPGSGSHTAISRREAIVGALALAAGALIASPPKTASAVDDGGPVLVGGSAQSENSTTILRLSTAGFLSIAGLNTNEGAREYGVDGQSLSGDAGSAGAFGHTAATGHYGVLARHSAGGTALRVEGTASFSRSGRSAVSKGHSTRIVEVPSGIGATTMILVTLQGDPGSGVYLRYATRESSTSFKVVISRPATKSVLFAWMLLR
jgi:hypothetical protein